MSTISTVRRLRRIFVGSNHNPAAKTPEPTITSLHTTNSTTQGIVNFLKRSSIHPEFRRRISNYETGIYRLVKAQHFSGIHEVIEHQKTYPDIRNEFFVCGLILLYGKAKMYDHARKLFDEMPKLNCSRSVFSFNALLESCIKSERYDEIGKLFRELPEKLSIVLNLMSYNLAMKALCKAGSVDSAVHLMDEIEKHGIKPNTVTCNTLLTALYESGRLTEAENLWNMMEKKTIDHDLRSYNIRLRGLLKANEVSNGIQLFEEIVNKGFKPSKFTYNALIKTYVDEGNLEQANMWYEKMEQNDCLPDAVTYRMLIPLACETKEFDFALHLCMKAIDAEVLIYRNIMQRVVDGLVEQSKIENAKELVKLVMSSKRFLYELSLPLHN
ncbi:pentatricopeptide repeat-containing protein, mitochondrial [Capsicum chacoense]|uniref:Pentatricopeptide repeat-containing protein At3g13160, mitochondrial-like n=1 Tax=Capsicum annuum TaxID=4072 RepID=A0A1U8GYB3_CAPAN|nr:pentatricopeptide repeat-containing protein At3g13160, mitochondrial [Capsicum annuum]KAF3644780.1 putative (-)-alpha-terpineol synthase-like isoform X1 [Capsicum annuum]KAF3655349.1 putative (-)-alpha-terpineol synthase-like isoform X1 [Capsicum annuum]PHT80343.1 hypothetical protein T459_18395 [Capsicum annuum]